MSKEREALKLALEWIESAPHGDNCFLHDDGEYNRCFCGKDSLQNFINEVLAQPEQELVAWLCPSRPPEHFAPITQWGATPPASFTEAEALEKGWFPVVRADTTPPQRTWVGLTDEEMPTLTAGLGPITLMPFKETKAFIRAIEAKLKEKNT